VFTFIVDHKLSVVEVVLGLMRGIWRKVLGFRIISSQNTLFLCSFLIFLLVGLVPLKKPKRALVQVFSGQTIEPVWFLKLCSNLHG
jgi:hypothetical protein